MGKKVTKKEIKLVYNLRLARRNQNVKKERVAYNKLRDYCDTNKKDMTELIEAALVELRKDVAAIMNGIV